MADVFISYHRSEGTSALVRRIAAELESMGISCWYDTKDPNPGYFVQTIEQEILCCKVFLLIWDKDANNSEWCLTETYTAFEGANRPVRIPFQIGNFTKDNDMKFYMKRCQTFHGGNPPEKSNIEKLIVKIAALFGKAPAKIIKSGSCGDNVTYQLDEHGLLTISGKGNMNDMSKAKYTPWWNEHELVYTVQIKQGVTSIGDAAFAGCSSLTSVTIPDSVTSIGGEAFCDCSNLIDIIIPDSVISIGDAAFSSCRRLTNITIPDSIVDFGLWVFYDCSSLNSVSIPAKMKIDPVALPHTTQIIRRE
ncbi:MAG: leucine-rich repeat protein [Oscillibacter sp.]|nr:leucine-rich repeat protein [Oscillibacter sp.]